MDVVLILDIFVINRIRSDSVRLMRRLQEREELFLELVRKFRNGSTGLGTNGEHFSHMRLRSRMGLTLALVCFGHIN